MEQIRQKWAERLQTMKNNRAEEMERNVLTDGEAYIFDQMISNTAEMIRDFSPIDLHTENTQLKEQVSLLQGENEKLREALQGLYDTIDRCLLSYHFGAEIGRAKEALKQQ
jgi:hypothetical protein